MCNEEDCELPNWIFEINEPKCNKTQIDQNENHLQFTKEIVVKRVYALGRILSHVLKEYNCHYWTSGGRHYINYPISQTGGSMDER